MNFIKVKLGQGALNSLLIIMALVISGPGLSGQDKSKKTEELMMIDQKFSDYSVKFGMNKAFFEFSDESVVLLKPQSLPLIGMKALKEFHAMIPDSLFTLSWEPSFAKVSNSGDLGYTYGVWKLEGNNMDGEGTYVTIWSKNKKGEWKMILDSGNDGLGKKE